MSMRKDILNSRCDIEKWILENRSKAYICKQLQCKQETLNHYLKKFGISYSGNRGAKNWFKKEQIPITDYLNDYKHISSYNLKRRLLRDGIKEHRCEKCGLSEWLGNQIPLELHHINGKDYDNNLGNIQLLCPNCHALTDNYRGKAKKHRL